MRTLAQHERNNGEVVNKYHLCEAIPINNEVWYDLWASCNLNSDLCDGGNDADRVGNNKHLWSYTNDDRRRFLKWNGTMVFDGWIQIVHGKVRRDEKRKIWNNLNEEDMPTAIIKGTPQEEVNHTNLTS